MLKPDFIERLFITGADSQEAKAPGPTRQVLVFLLCLLMVIIVGYADYLTGFEIVVFSFYLLPIRIASLRFGLAGGAIICLCSTLAWDVSDYYAGHRYANELITVWNSLVRLTSFLIVCWLSARNAELFAKERATSAKLRKALSEIKLIEGLLPICATCKKIRDDKGRWNMLELYIQDHSTATFTHSMCPECTKKWAKEAGLD